MGAKKESPSLPARCRDFMHATVLEVRKSNWPERRVLVAHTFIVIGAVFTMGLFLGISDRILASLLRLILPGY